MSRKLKLLGVHLVSILAFIGLILPFMAIFVVVIILVGLAEMYANLYKFLKIYVFKLDKPRTDCYNVINSDE